MWLPLPADPLATRDNKKTFETHVLGITQGQAPVTMGEQTYRGQLIS